MVGYNKNGFTIVELLIVIVVIGVLASITVVAFKGIQDRASDGASISGIKSAQKKLELYKAEFGTYPVTGIYSGRTDPNCLQGPQYEDWIPGLTGLPKSNNASFYGGMRGCFVYLSDGRNYVLSAWGMIKKDMLGQEGYNVLGAREMDIGTDRPPSYYCNHSGIGGSGNPARSYYRHSYTITNITTDTCSTTVDNPLP